MTLPLALASDPDFVLDVFETEVPRPLVPCAICTKRDASDPACFVVDFEGERRGVCETCYLRGEEAVLIPLDYMEGDE